MKRRAFALLPGFGLVLLVLLPLLGLLSQATPSTLWAGLQHPQFGPALWLSLRTSLWALLWIVALGTPLAWWLARTQNPAANAIELLFDLPILLPPAVVGIALLVTFGKRGLLGPGLAAVGLHLPFSAAAVVLAQIVVASPFYVQSAIASFRRLDDDLLLVARTLGRSPQGAFVRVALPLALPGLLTGAALAWGRALGEFGATLLFAGNLPGHTQTMPLAIYNAMESDIRVAVALSLCLAGLGVLLLFGLRWLARKQASEMSTSGPSS